MPEETAEAPGIALMCNPGVTAVWTTRDFEIERSNDGYLCFIGEPEHVRWYAEGRTATRAEILASIDSGLPALRELAEQDGARAVTELDRYVERAMTLVSA